MPTTPAGAKKPQDRKPSAADALEQELTEDELLADMPELKAPGRLRVRDRNRILKLALRLQEFTDDKDGDDAEVASISLDANDERMPLLLDILAEVDEFAESIATDPVAYVEWSLGKGYEVFSALLLRYSSAVGESNAS